MSSPHDSPIPKPLDQVEPRTLAELAALGDEIAALVRAGIPLEAGLQATAKDLPRKLGKLAESLAGRLAQGQSLSAALAAERPEYPPALLAVVEAGMRSGRPAQALEGVAEAAHQLVDLRGALVRALVYPLFVLLAACGLTALYLSKVAPALSEALADFDSPAADSWQTLLAAAERWRFALWLVPAALVVLLAATWFATARAGTLDGGWMQGLLSWLPGVRRMFRSWDAARVTSLLALLVEQRVPWPEAIRLAGQSSGRAKVRRASRQWADASAAGVAAPRSPALDDLPPLVAWAFSQGAAGAALPAILRESAASYRRQALADADFVRLIFPALALAAIGGLATLAYALLLFTPIVQMFRALENPFFS